MTTVDTKAKDTVNSPKIEVKPAAEVKKEDAAKAAEAPKKV